MISTRIFVATAFLLLLTNTSLLANGGAWQAGVPTTGNGAASDRKKATDVTIEEENLTIDLHQEFAAAEVRYRMRNTGPQVEQDFFFPVERWAKNEENKVSDLEEYRVAADGTELKSETVEAKGEKPKPVTDKHWGEFPPAVRLWKKSRIPFARGQTRELSIRYRADYALIESSVSDDGHVGEALFYYSLSPAATWKGPIGKGKITVNVVHPRPEEVTISKPKDRFKKVNATQSVWDFRDLKPTLADNIKIVVHPAYDTYPGRHEFGAKDYEGPFQFRAEYIIQGNRSFIEHSDYDAVASSTLKPDGEHKYDVENIKYVETYGTWAEGVEGDGIGENIAMKVHRPLPLDAIMIMPGYRAEDEELWGKNNRIAEMEVTLNGEHTFTAAIPDEKFSKAYPIPVRNYSKPVETVKLTIKGVHRGSAARDTCISAVDLRARLSKKPTIQPAR
jgi:hypothetical protein